MGWACTSIGLPTAAGGGGRARERGDNETIHRMAFDWLWRQSGLLASRRGSSSYSTQEEELFTPLQPRGSKGFDGLWVQTAGNDHQKYSRESRYCNVYFRGHSDGLFDSFGWRGRGTMKFRRPARERATGCAEEQI